MLIVESASLSYAQKSIFKDLSFQLGKGQWLALLGRSGVGKTSLLRLIAGLPRLRPEADTEVKGRVLWQGGPLLQAAYMAQQDGLFPWKTVLGNVLLPFQLRGHDLPVAKAEALLLEVGLKKVADAYPGTLSGGMRQRVALVRTLLQDAPVVLMDEPFSALDAITRLEMQDLAINLLRQAQKTVVLVTHDPWEALRIADEIKVLSAPPVQIQTYQKPSKARWLQAYEDLLQLLGSRHEKNA